MLHPFPHLPLYFIILFYFLASSVDLLKKKWHFWRADAARTPVKYQWEAAGDAIGALASCSWKKIEHMR